MAKIRGTKQEGHRRLPTMLLCVFVSGYYGNLTQTVGTLNRAQFADRPQTNVLVLGDGSVGHISICFGYSLRLGCVALCISYVDMETRLSVPIIHCSFLSSMN